MSAPRRHPTRVAALTMALVALPLGAGAQASAQPLAPVSAALSSLLATATDALPVTVLVHGNSAAAADGAARSAGLTPVTSFTKIGVVAAREELHAILSRQSPANVFEVIESGA